MKPGSKWIVTLGDQKGKTKNPYYGDCILVPISVEQAIIRAFYWNKLGAVGGRELARGLVAGEIDPEVESKVMALRRDVKYIGARGEEINRLVPVKLLEYLAEAKIENTHRVAWAINQLFKSDFGYAGIFYPGGLCAFTKRPLHANSTEMTRLQRDQCLRFLSVEQAKEMREAYSKLKGTLPLAGRHPSARAWAWTWNTHWEPLRAS